MAYEVLSKTYWAGQYLQRWPVDHDRHLDLRLQHSLVVEVGREIPLKNRRLDDVPWKFVPSPT